MFKIKNYNREQIEEKSLNRIIGNDIICLHDGRVKSNKYLKMIKAKMVDNYEK